jgi:glycosyltransferase involved in cell wall biosynthesis
MISICMIVKNGAVSLPKTLESARSFSEVILLDNGSTDGTLEIAKTFSNVRIFKSPFIGFGALRNKAATYATYDWILALDSDEILSEELLEEIAALRLDPECVYSMPRRNFYRGKWIRGCGWHPDRVTRLYYKLKARYVEAKVHESVASDGAVIKLKGPLLHTPYLSKADFLAKRERYSTLFAEDHRGKKRSSVGRAILSGSFAFFRSYVLQRGFLDGREGWTISSHNAACAFYKYLKLVEIKK